MKCVVLLPVGLSCPHVQLWFRSAVGLGRGQISDVKARASGVIYYSRVHVHVMVSSSLLAHGRDVACFVVVGVVVFCTFVRKVGLCGLFRW